MLSFVSCVFPIHSQPSPIVEVKLAFPSSNPPLPSSLSSSLGWELPGSAISSSKPRCRGKTGQMAAFPKEKNPWRSFVKISDWLWKKMCQKITMFLCFFFEFGYIHLRYHLVTWVIVCTILSNKRGTEFIPIHLFPWGEVSLYRFHWWDRCHWTTARCWYGRRKWWTWTNTESDPWLEELLVSENSIWGFPKMLVPNNHWFSY